MSNQASEKRLPGGVFLVFNQMVHPLNKSVTSLGRSANNDLVIQGEGISRLHAEIRYDYDDFTIYDMDSTNGIFINERPVKKYDLKSGTLFYLANIALVFVRDDAKVTDSLEMDTGELK
jgi:pSer/pThr/pTyr-binding forkhead associated (FHA) protein